MRRKLAAGNWKMNGLKANLSELDTLAKSHADTNIDILICPPATLLRDAAEITTDTAVKIGAQDCHAALSGAHTGEISAVQIKDAGARAVILGHSERRENHDENSELVRGKARTAQAEGLTTIICLGESAAERDSQNTLDIIGGQLAGSIPDGSTGENLVIAYEPIWAIGTGLIPTLEQISEVHSFMRARLERRFGEGVGRSVRLLYGGSVKPNNAAEIFTVPNVDGALVGGASLCEQDFTPIINALAAS